MYLKVLARIFKKLTELRIWSGRNKSISEEYSETFCRDISITEKRNKENKNFCLTSKKDIQYKLLLTTKPFNYFECLRIAYEKYCSLNLRKGKYFK